MVFFTKLQCPQHTFKWLFFPLWEISWGDSTFQFLDLQMEGE